jgi:hypothetical protein
VIRSGGRAPVTIAALPRKSVNREDTMAQLDAYDQRPASPILSDASEWSEEFFTTRLDALKAEGRYRVFAELERRVGEFPRALEHRLGSDVSAWCSK